MSPPTPMKITVLNCAGFLDDSRIAIFNGKTTSNIKLNNKLFSFHITHMSLRQLQYPYD